jgi:hypothetical protein
MPPRGLFPASIGWFVAAPSRLVSLRFWRRRLSGGAAARSLLRGALLAGSLASCMSTPEPSRTSFMSLTEGVRQPVNTPTGLNPLGTLEVCKADAPPQPLRERVLVSTPEQFTREASLMLAGLRQALADDRPDGRPVQFLVSARPIDSPAVAQAEGGRCGALVVLWEPLGTRVLELTLPNPAKIPLRATIYPRLCEFGNYQEQYDILYLTITGLLAMLDNRYERAVSYLDQAKRIDSHCLQLPGVAQ